MYARIGVAYVVMSAYIITVPGLQASRRHFCCASPGKTKQEIDEPPPYRCWHFGLVVKRWLGH
jgi:hypothetical protein